MQEYLNTTHQTVAWVKSISDAGHLETRPPFQRNPVWLHPQKSYLIDTILRGYPIPELYMQVAVTDTGSETHVVVDGQQRIRAVLEFLEGAWSLHPQESPDWADLYFDDLTREEKVRLFNYKFVIRVLPEIPEEELRAIFRRLNRNVVSLNAQELRHATYWGEFISTMSELSDDDFWTDAGIFTANDFRRMLDIEYISELAVGVLHGPQNKKGSLDKWYEAYEEEFPKRRELLKTFRTVLAELSEVLPSESRTRWRKKSDFYSLFLHFAERESVLPLARDERALVQDRLVQFGQEVTEFLSVQHEDEASADSIVINYANAVQRAASDLGNRRAREKALAELLHDAWESASSVG